MLTSKRGGTHQRYRFFRTQKKKNSCGSWKDQRIADKQVT